MGNNNAADDSFITAAIKFYSLPAFRAIIREVNTSALPRVRKTAQCCELTLCFAEGRADEMRMFTDFRLPKIPANTALRVLLEGCQPQHHGKILSLIIHIPFSLS